MTLVKADACGVSAFDRSGTLSWESPWSTLVFSNGRDLILGGGSVGVLHIDTESESERMLEELVIKYGSYRQMHF